MNDFLQYKEAEFKINEGLIRMDISSARPEGYVKNPNSRMETMRQFLAACGDPQKSIPAIHVTGTSGKGSVCAAIAGILQSWGLKVGLHISPYLQSATEKIWIDGQYISGKEFGKLVDWIMPLALPYRNPETPASIHGMASVAIALEAFRRDRVDVMVFEAGCGGRFDLTSFIDTEVAVITNVGLDHTVSLGPNIEDIAWHKAGIIRKGIQVVTGTTGVALDVIKREAEMLNAPVEIIPNTDGPRKHNFHLAKKAANAFGRRHQIPITDKISMDGIHSVKLPGRFEKIADKATVFLDGAHNADKLTAAVNHVLDDESSQNGPRIAVVGILGTKADAATLAPLSAKFDQIIVTEPNVYGKKAFPASQTAVFLSDETPEPIICPNPHEAVDLALNLAIGGTVLICGSFYLCGDVRSRWFSKEEVVCQRTSWPAPT
ncbi:MAG: hypothetical protein JXR76_07180 [Deltaproteobacteria bacterium]|nr:hypothetical protein [Deltaproteobacteria bacterium]